MPLRELKGIFPKLSATANTITSPIDANYNCHAWSVGNNKSWYEPFGLILPNPFPPYQWPEDIPHDRSPDTFKRFFGKFGFKPTKNGDLEEGLEKIAIYVREDEVQHTARQLPNGQWTSKMGKQEDIQHSLQELETDGPFGYGAVSIFMERPIRTVVNS